MSADNLQTFRDTACRAFDLAQEKETAIIITMHGPVALSTNSRDYKRAKPERIIGVYNESVNFQWILDDLKTQLTGKS